MTEVFWVCTEVFHYEITTTAKELVFITTSIQVDHFTVCIKFPDLSQILQVAAT